MNNKEAAGLLMYRLREGKIEYFLVHPGGPYFVKKDIWTIPKGLPEPGEDLLQTACREFFEETGIQPAPPYHPLGSIRQKSGKQVYAWGFSGEWDPSSGIKCNLFTMEWPPKSGKTAEFPEVDQGQWMNYDDAIEKIIAEQRPLLHRLQQALFNDER